MKFYIDVERAPWTFAVAAGAVVYGTALQLGYFSAIGMEFLSFVGIADWLFSFAIMLPVLFLAVMVCTWLYGKMKTGQLKLSNNEATPANGPLWRKLLTWIVVSSIVLLLMLYASQWLNKSDC